MQIIYHSTLYDKFAWIKYTHCAHILNNVNFLIFFSRNPLNPLLCNRFYKLQYITMTLWITVYWYSYAIFMERVGCTHPLLHFICTFFQYNRSSSCFPATFETPTHWPNHLKTARIRLCNRFSASIQSAFDVRYYWPKWHGVKNN